MACCDNGEEGIRAALRRDDVNTATTLTIELYGREIYLWLLTTMGHDEVATSDVFQDFAERLVVNIGRFRWECRLRTWAYQLARSARHHHTCNPHNRQKFGRVSQLASKLFETISSLINARERRDAYQRLVQSELSADEREILILRVDREMSWDEVARVVEGAELQGSALKRATDRLRQRFRIIKQRLKRAARKKKLY